MVSRTGNLLSLSPTPHKPQLHWVPKGAYRHPYFEKSPDMILLGSVKTAGLGVQGVYRVVRAL